MHLHPYSLDFAKDDVHVGEGDALAVDHAAVLAELGPVLAVHFLAGGAGVTVDGEAPERLLQSGQLYGRRGTHASFAGAIRVRRKPFGRPVFRLVRVRP